MLLSTSNTPWPTTAAGPPSRLKLFFLLFDLMGQLAVSSRWKHPSLVSSAPIGVPTLRPGRSEDTRRRARKEQAPRENSGILGQGKSGGFVLKLWTGENSPKKALL